MNLVVVDTNVAIVANGRSEQAPAELVEKCIEALLQVRNNGCLTMDKEGLLFAEYMHELSFSGQPGMGDAFFKWVNDNQWNSECCEMRALNCLNEIEQTFAEFPEHVDLENFDISDRKFVALANAGESKARILQAVDFKWWGWKDALKQVGIEVDFLEEELAEKRYQEHLGQ